MMDIRPLLRELFGAEGIPCTEKQEDQLQRYMELLLEWNEKINLTAITEPEQVAVKHFLDCALLIKNGKFSEKFGDSFTLIDVGTGAGFPGMVVKILCPQIELTLLDSLNKRLLFLEEVEKELQLDGPKNVIVHARAEEGGRKPELRCAFDAAAARAVAPLNLLAEYCMPFVKEGGVFFSMKGPGVEQELEASRAAFGQLGGKVQECMEYELPGGDKRSLVEVKRVKPLSDVYPRPTAKIKKRPL